MGRALTKIERKAMPDDVSREESEFLICGIIRRRWIMKKVIRIIFRAIFCIFLLITFLFLLNTAFGYQISWINFLLRLPTKDLVILIYMGWIVVSLIAWAFSNWFDDLNILKSDIEK